MRLILEERLILYSTQIISLLNEIPDVNELGTFKKIILNHSLKISYTYSNAFTSQSKKEFKRYVKFALMYLKNTHLNLRIIIELKIIPISPKFDSMLEETEELIAIFSKNVRELNGRANKSYQIYSAFENPN